MKVSSQIKQIIVIRKDLKMRRGKEIAQGAHASGMFLRGLYLDCHIIQLTSEEKEWMTGNFAKVTLQVDSEKELLEIDQKAKEAGLVCHIVTDAGLTEFNGVPTKTCLAIGPDESEKIDKITGHLKLY